MKIGWLVWEYEDDERPTLWTEEPPRWCARVVQIVYSEIVT